jgi:diacylglycerol kinase family enzyme
MKKFVFLINPGSGSVNDRRIKELHRAITTAQIEAEVMLTGPDIKAQSEKLRDGGYTAVIAAGGDGTLRAVAAALAGTNTAFGVLPWGTFNHFAKSLHVPDNLEIILAALQTGKTRQVDVGEVNGEVFLNNAALGVYPQFVLDREKIQSKIGKFPAALIASIKLFIEYRTYSLTLVINGETKLFRTPLVFIGNNDYQIDRLGLIARENVDKGELCVYTLDSTKRIDLVKLAWWATLGVTKNMSLFHQFNPTELYIEAPRARTLLVGLDGEVERMTLPLRVKLERKNLKLIDAKESQF